MAGKSVEVVPRIGAATLQLLAARIGERPGSGRVVGLLRMRRHRLEPVRPAEAQDPDLTVARDEMFRGFKSP